MRRSILFCGQLSKTKCLERHFDGQQDMLTYLCGRDSIGSVSGTGRSVIRVSQCAHCHDYLSICEGHKNTHEAVWEQLASDTKTRVLICFSLGVWLIVVIRNCMGGIHHWVDALRHQWTLPTKVKQ
jgi:hypothetical protein